MVLRRNILALAIASACFGTCSAAVAANAAANNAANAPQTSQDQSTPANADTGDTSKTDQTRKKKEAEKAPTLQAIQVKGYAASLQNSIAIQRNSDEIVEAVSAEQIGKLPGTSIADTLGRLPGLAVQTLGGRPQVLTIHGLGPDFSTALVNGREQVSTSNNRDVQYDQYPASWFSSVVVHLSPSADLIGQGLSGTVDMRTIRPLEQNQRVMAVNAGYQWDSLSTLSPGPGVHDNGYKVNGVYVDQFADHTLGVTLGVDLESDPSQIEHQAPWGYPTDSSGDLVVGGSKNYGISDQLKRMGLLTTVQWRPIENFTSTLDLTYDNFREKQQAKGMEFPLFWGGLAPIPGNVSNGFVQSGTYSGVSPVVRNDYNSTRDKVWNIGWNNQYRFNEDWSAQMDASYSRADTSGQEWESYSGFGYKKSGPTDTLAFQELGNGLLYVHPTLDYTQGLVLTDPQGWGSGNNPPVVQAGFLNAPRTNDYLAHLKLSVEREFASGPFSSAEFGVDRATRDKTYNIDQAFIIPANGAQTAPIPAFATTGDPLAWMGVGPQVIYNPFDLINNGTEVLFPTALSSIGVPPNWKVRENDLTPYLQFNLDTHLGNVSVRGNIGLQVAHTNQSSTGQRVSAGTSTTGSSLVTLIPVTGGTSYTRWLPSANLVFGFTDSTDLRVGLSRVMARPRMDQMSASLSISGNITHLSSTDPNTSYFSASGGNFKLLPTMADNFNVSLEHYFGNNKGYAALSAYYLKLHDYINPSAAFLYDFTPFIGAYLNSQQQQQLGTPLGIISGPTNDGHGSVKGLQGVLNLPLEQVTPWLEGFGVVLSADYTNSSVVYAGNPQAITVPGLSKWVLNDTVYYQHDGFEARVSQNYRSSFLGEVQGISATRILQTIKGGNTYDAQISYTMQDGPMKGLTFILQGSNLTNKIFTTYQNNDPRQVLTWEEYGRRYDVGVSYKFQ